MKKVLMWLGLALLAVMGGLGAMLGFKKKRKETGPEIARRRAAAARLVRQELARRQAEEEVENAKRNSTFADSLRRDGAGRPKS